MEKRQEATPELNQSITFEDVCRIVQVRIQGSATIEGVEIPLEVVAKTLHARIWKSARVVKNKRTADNAGGKPVIAWALANGKINPEQGLQILLLGDKSKIAELRALMPKTEKEDNPTLADLQVAIEQVKRNGGQMA